MSSSSSATTLVNAADNGQFFAVEPRTNCPHITHISSDRANVAVDTTKECATCQDTKENWQCLTCQEVFCSRYVKGHMNQHFLETEHSIAISFSDLSFWCFSCDDYITSPLLKDIENAAYLSKFGEIPPQQALQIVEDHLKSNAPNGTEK